MRRLRIVVQRSRGALPVLAAATIVSAASCSDDDEQSQGRAKVDAAGGASGGRDSGSVSGGVGGVINRFTDSGVSDTRSDSWNGTTCFTNVIELPEAGVPAEPGQICAITTQPVGSYQAARVTLAKVATSLAVVNGSITIDPMLAGLVVGLPSLIVVYATVVELTQLELSGMVAAPGGFAFQGRWPVPLSVSSYGGDWMTIQILFDIACDADAGDVRRVEALTAVHACVDENNQLEWVSSGDDCTICQIVAEMAPSPIVPDKLRDDLPLARVIRLRLVELARVGSTVVLFAENDGGEDVEYVWQASSGVLERLAPDIAVWSGREQGASQVQVAVLGELGVAVRSYSPELRA